MSHILLLEDDPDIRQGVTQHFVRDGLTVCPCETGKEALALLMGAEGPGLDVAILDLTLPDMDGLDILKIIRHHPALRALPVVVVTARNEVVDRIVGLELGADDYVSKPFSMRELSARVRALMRRSRFSVEQEPWEGQALAFGPLRMDLDAYVAWMGGRAVDLTRREFELLAYLMRHPGRVMSRDRLLKDVWGLEYGGETRTVDAHVRRLRAKLGGFAEVIETVIGVGYKLRPVESIP